MSERGLSRLSVRVVEGELIRDDDDEGQKRAEQIAWGNACQAHRARCAHLSALLTAANRRPVQVEQAEAEAGSRYVPRSPLRDTPELWGALVRCDGVVRNICGEDLDRLLAEARAGQPWILPAPTVEREHEDTRPPGLARFLAELKTWRPGSPPPSLEGA